MSRLVKTGVFIIVSSFTEKGWKEEVSRWKRKRWGRGDMYGVVMKNDTMFFLILQTEDKRP